MIISVIMGGLGNQLFQYATARRVAYVNNVPLKIETFGYHFKQSKHGFCLDKFNIKAQHTSILDYAKLVPQFLYKPTVIKEKLKEYDNSFLNIKDNVILVGYWHTEKYFSDIADIIRDDLTLKFPSSQTNVSMKEKIESVNAISIHIRRTDFIKWPDLFEFCSLDYYYEAIRIMANSVKDPHFFFFSDDQQWVKENFKIDFPVTFVDHNDDIYHNYEDLTLMSKCKHHIIDNSSFGWWGAWLNANKEKIVIAPKKWMKDPAMERPDITPDNWIKI